MSGYIMSGYIFALALSLAVVLFLIYLMRKRRLREKYAILWLVLAALVIIVGAFPELVFLLTRAVGVEVPSNLVFAVAIVFLLLVCIQLSTEVTAVQEQTRTLTEEVALLRMDIEKLRAERAVSAEVSHSNSN